MRTAYNMIIYEALDFTVGLFDAQGNTVSIGLGLPMFIRGMSDTVKTKLDALRRREPRSRRHPAHQRRLHHRQPPQPHDLHGADLPRRRGGGVLLLHGALARRRRHARRRHDRHLLRRPADADREDLPQGRAERGADLDHQDQRAPARARDGRLPRPDRRGQDRRAALPRDDPEIRPRRRGRRHRGDHGSQRGGHARARRADSRRRLRGGIVHGRRRRQDRRARADPRAGRGQGRPDEGRPHRRVEAGGRLLQFRRDRRAAPAARWRSSA